MPRPGKGFSAKEWAALSPDDRERIKKEHTRQSAKKCYETVYATNAEKIREYNNDAYHRNKESRIQKVREYQKRKKVETEKHTAFIESEIEKYKVRTELLESVIKNAGLTIP